MRTPKPVAQPITFKGAVLERTLADHRTHGTPLVVYAPAPNGKEIAGMVVVEVTIKGGR